MLKKSISALLVLLMLLSVFTIAPVTASAEEPDSQEANVAEISDDIPADAELSDNAGEDDIAPVTDDGASVPEAANKYLQASGTEKTEGASDEAITENGSQKEDIASTGAGKEAYEKGQGGDTLKAEYVEGEAIVVFKDEMDIEAIEDEVTVEDTMELENAKDGDVTNVAVVSDDSRSTQEIIEELEGNDSVEYVVRNTTAHFSALTNDTYANYQWALDNKAHNSGTSNVDTNPENLWNKVSSSAQESVVAIMDTGVDATHEDLKSVMWKNDIPSLEGYGSYGYDFTGQVAGGVPTDDVGHGTHCAGIVAAAANNSLGISGINKSKVKIMALKVNYGDAVDFDAILDAFDYVIRAKKAGVNVTAVNCSFGGLYTLQEMNLYNNRINQLGELGVVTCVAAGNENMNVDKTYYVDGEANRIGPAACTSKYCVTVAAADENGDCVSFSNYGTDSVDIAAPGVNILSTVSNYNFEPSIYTSTQRSNLCKYYQGFDSDIQDGQLFSTWYRVGDYQNMSMGCDSEDYFGPSGRSWYIKHTSSTTSPTSYGFSLPYTLSNTTGKYYISFNVKVWGPCSMGVFDSVSSSSIDLSGTICDFDPQVEWYTVTVLVDPNTMPDYKKSVNRELYFYFLRESTGTLWIQLDNVTISKQGLSTSQFGKYAFYQGTSMACPYVAGAAALAAAAYPAASAEQVVNAIKSSAKTHGNLSEYVEGGRFLDLQNLTIDSAVAVSSISIPSSKSISVGGSTTLSASISPSNASNKFVSWSVSPANTNVVSISADGTSCIVTGKAAGTATVTAKSSNGKTSSCTVTVGSSTVAVTGISVSPTSKTLSVGGTATLSATISPSNATNKNVNWTVTNPSGKTVATISSNGASCTVTGKAAGTATVKATSAYSSSIYATCTITVTDSSSSGDAVTNVQNIKTFISANKNRDDDDDGENYLYSFTNEFGNRTHVYLIRTTDDKLMFYYIEVLSDTLTVHTSFKYSPGTTNASYDITPGMGIYDDGTRILGYSGTLNAKTYNPSNGFTVTGTYDSNYFDSESEAKQNAVVCLNRALLGINTALADNVMLKLGDIGFEYYEKYSGGTSDVPVTSVSLNKTSASIDIGSTVSLSATISPSNATNKTVTWSVSPSNTNVISISTNGTSCTVTGKAAGSATVIATSSNGKTASCTVTVKSVQVATPQITSLTSGKGGITIKWNSVSGASAYDLLWYSPNDGTWYILKSKISGTSFVDSDVSYGRKETYSIRAVDSSGSPISSFNSTGWSTTYSVDTPQITSLTSTEDGITIKWNKVSDCTTYRVYYRTSDGGWKRFANDITGTTKLDTGVAYGRQEAYTVRALNDKGELISAHKSTGWSTTFGVSTPKISSTTSSASGVLIKWNAVSGASTYRVYYKGRNGWTKMKDVKGTSYTDSDVRFGGTYTYTVRCVNPAGNMFISGFDSNGKVHTHYLSTPSITGFESLANGVKIKWNAVSNAQKYRVYYKGSKGWTSMGEVTGTSFVDTDVRSGSAYYYTVRCINNGLTQFMSDCNSSGWRYVYNPSFSTPKISSASTSSSGVTVKWSAISGVKYYRVYYKTPSGSWTKMADTTATSYTHTGARYGYNYYYTVRCLTDNKKDFASSFTSSSQITYWSLPVLTSVWYSSGKLYFNISDWHTSYAYVLFAWTGSDWDPIGYSTSKSGYYNVGTSFRSGSKYSFTVLGVNSNFDATSYFDSDGFTFTV